MLIQTVRFVTLSAVCNDPNVHDAIYTELKNGGELVAPLLNTVRQLVLPELVERALNNVVGTDSNISTAQLFEVLDRIDGIPHGVLIDTDN